MQYRDYVPIFAYVMNVISCIIMYKYVKTPLTNSFTFNILLQLSRRACCNVRNPAYL